MPRIRKRIQEKLDEGWLIKECFGLLMLRNPFWNDDVNVKCGMVDVVIESDAIGTIDSSSIDSSKGAVISNNKEIPSCFTIRLAERKGKKVVGERVKLLIPLLLYPASNFGTP